MTQQPRSEAGAGQELEVGRTRPRQYEVWGYGLLMVTLIRWELVLQTRALLGPTGTFSKDVFSQGAVN